MIQSFFNDQRIISVRMTELNEGISSIDFLSATSSNSLMLCKDLRELEPNYNPNDIIDGSFKITSLLTKSKNWFNCAGNVVMPEIISHYLHLNLTFATPNNDFDGTMGYVNGTHASGPLKMIANNQVDYETDDIYLSEKLWHPEMIDMSTTLGQSYAINFIVKKQINRISIGYSLNMFNFLIWMLLITSIVLITIIHGLIMFVKKIHNMNTVMKFIFKLIYGYFNLLMAGQTSSFLSKIKPRHYLMYLIPLLSIIVINLRSSFIYSNMISPQKQWCESIDCFAKSNLKFYALERDNAFNLLMKKNDKQIKSIVSRVQVFHNEGKVN